MNNLWRNALLTILVAYIRSRTPTFSQTFSLMNSASYYYALKLMYCSQFIGAFSTIKPFKFSITCSSQWLTNLSYFTPLKLLVENQNLKDCTTTDLNWNSKFASNFFTDNVVSTESPQVRDLIFIISFWYLYSLFF